MKSDANPATTIWWWRTAWVWSAILVKICWVTQQRGDMPKGSGVASLAFAVIACGLAVVKQWRADGADGAIWAFMNAIASVLIAVFLLMAIAIDYGFRHLHLS